jgi:O-antigen/teichoic acid export membrane protein
VGEEGGILKNTSLLFIGRVVSLAMKVVYAAILARYVLAEGVGQLSTASSVVGIVALLTSFGLPTLLTRDIAAHRDRTGAYVGSALWLVIVLSGLMVLILAGVILWTPYPALIIELMWLYAVVYALDALSNITMATFQAYERMGYVAALQFGRDAINVVGSILGIYLHASLATLVGVSILASAAKFVASLFLLDWRLVRLSMRPVFCVIRQLLLACVPFAILAVLLSTDREINTFILSLHRSSAEVGWFSSANMMVNYASILPNVFLQAILPVFSRQRSASEEALRATYQRGFRWLVLLGLPMGVGLALIAAPLVNMLYGPGFEQAGLALMIMTPLVVLMPSYVNGALMLGAGRQKLFAGLMAATVGLDLLLCLLLVPAWGYVGASVAAVIPRVLLFIPTTLFCHRQLKLKLPWDAALKAALGAAAMALAALAVKASRGNPLFTVLLTAPVVYVVALTLLSAWTEQELGLMRRVMARFRGLLESWGWR